MKGSTPTSSSLVMAPRAVLVWIVEKTRWPVMAARTAISAVSPSRISPTIMTSGSCLRIERSAEAKVMPALMFTWAWLTPDISFSIGSSIETMFLSCELILWRAA